MAKPLRVLEADLIHPRGKPVGVWETKTTKTARKAGFWGSKSRKTAENGPKRRFWTANGRKFTQTCHAKGVVGIFEPSLKTGLQTGSGT